MKLLGWLFSACPLYSFPSSSVCSGPSRWLLPVGSWWIWLTWGTRGIGGREEGSLEGQLNQLSAGWGLGIAWIPPPPQLLWDGLFQGASSAQLQVVGWQQLCLCESLILQFGSCWSTHCTTISVSTLPYESSLFSFWVYSELWLYDPVWQDSF